MTEAQIKYMTEQFLRWKLPSPWYPDGGVSFKPTYQGVGGIELSHEPTGTNLFSYTQVKEMIEHMLEGMPSE